MILLFFKVRTPTKEPPQKLVFKLHKTEYVDEIKIGLRLKPGVTEGTLSELSIRACLEGKYIN